jgi:hypothetical protein
MEEKYGKKQATLRSQGMILLPLIMAVILLAVVFSAVLVTGLKSGSINYPVVIVSGLLALAVIVLVVRQIISVGLIVYERGLVQVNMFGKREIAADDISAMVWTFPGTNPLNSRAARINNTAADIIFKDGSKSLKVQDSYYRDLEKELSSFQSRNNIPANLEKKSKSKRYD